MWIATDLLKIEGARSIKVMRGNRMGNKDGVVYWMVIPSAYYAKRTGRHIIAMVPETKLKPLKND